MSESAETTTIKVREMSDCFLVLRRMNASDWEGYQLRHPLPHDAVAVVPYGVPHQRRSEIHVNRRLHVHHLPLLLPLLCICIPHDGTSRVRVNQRLVTHPHPSIPGKSEFLLVLRAGKS